MAGQRLVDGVVDDLVDHVVQARAVVGVADIHARPLANGIQALQNLDGIGAVFGRHAGTFSDWSLMKCFRLTAARRSAKAAPNSGLETCSIYRRSGLNSKLLTAFAGGQNNRRYGGFWIAAPSEWPA